MKWDILILTHDRVEALRPLLDDLDTLLEVRSDVQVVILDNASGEETRRVLAKWAWGSCASQKLLLNEPQNHGVAVGRNLLAVESSADYVVFLDSDVRIRDVKFLDRLEDNLNRLHVGVCGPAASVVAWMGEGVQYFPVTNTADVVSGWCMAARGELVRDMPHDPGYGLFWEEDSDWCLQVKAAGWRVVGTGYIGVDHVPGLSGDKPGLRDLNIKRLRERWMGKGVIEGEKP